MIYLDNAATTKVDSSLKPLIDECLYNGYGNASSTHSLGTKAKTLVDEARKNVAETLSTSPENVIFTSGGSEANTLAIVGIADYLKTLSRNHIITTKYEHHSVLNAMKEMERRGFCVTYLNVPNGTVDYDEFLASVQDDTGLVSIMYMNNELGTKNNIAPIYEFCKEKNIVFHSDCVQAICTENIELDKIADMISISGHKLHAPKGVGCLCTRYKNRLSNIIFGGQQEFGVRPGTENVANIAAFGQEMYHSYNSKERIATRIDLVSLAFGGRLLQLCDEYGIEPPAFNAAHFRNTSKICSIRFDGIDAETLVALLSNRGVCVSAGSACTSHYSQPSHVLKAIGLSDEQARSTIRVSFSEYNTVTEAHEAAEILLQCVETLTGLKDIEQIDA